MADASMATAQTPLPLLEADLLTTPNPVGLGQVAQIDDTCSPSELRIGERAPFHEVRDFMRALLNASAEAYRGTEMLIDVGDRRFDLFDLRRLAHVMTEEFGIYVVGVRASVESLRRHAERELKFPVHVIEPEQESLPEENSAPAGDSCEVPEATEPSVEPETATRDLALLEGERLQTVHRTLRSGSVTRSRGDLLIVGDVNPGAQIRAGGSIIVLGALKGEAHAGQKRPEDAFVFALTMSATSLRIGEQLAQPIESTRKLDPSEVGPYVATVERNQILIQPYRGRLPRTLG
jgi:septum site-determining protein MinC